MLRDYFWSDIHDVGSSTFANTTTMPLVVLPDNTAVNAADDAEEVGGEEGTPSKSMIRRSGSTSNDSPKGVDELLVVESPSEEDTKNNNTTPPPKSVLRRNKQPSPVKLQKGVSFEKSIERKLSESETNTNIVVNDNNKDEKEVSTTNNKLLLQSTNTDNKTNTTTNDNDAAAIFDCSNPSYFVDGLAELCYVDEILCAVGVVGKRESKNNGGGGRRSKVLQKP